MTFADPPDNPLVRAISAPSRAVQGITGFRTSATPLDPNYQRNLTTLTNKYTELAQQVAQLPEPIRNSLINYDSKRVAYGAAPMTRQQTLLAVQTAVTGQQATPQPDRNPLNVLGNVRSDMGDILKSLPRLPIALWNEAQAVTRLPEYMQQVQSQGTNPLAAILQAPGVRLIPGTYAAGNLARGREGLQELATHPLIAALDVLPLAHQAASATKVGALSEAARSAEGLRPRPISAVLTNRLAEDAAGTPTLARNTLGQVTDTIRNETRVGQALDAFGGRRSRDVARMRGTLEQRYRSLLTGKGTPADTVEAFLPRVRNIFEKYSDQYPEFKQDASVAGPEWDTKRAAFYDDIQRDPSKYDPALVNEIRDLNYDMAKSQEAAGNLTQFDGEWYPTEIGKQLTGREARVAHTQRMVALRNEYMNPSGQMNVQQLRQVASDIAGETNTAQRSQLGQAFEATLDAYGVDVKPIQSARAAIATRKGTLAQWQQAVDGVLNDPNLVLQPRRTTSAIIAELKPVGDRQGTLLESAVRHGDRNETTARLKNIYSRQHNNMTDPVFREDARSMARRTAFDNKVGRLFTPERLAQRTKSFDTFKASQAPARFQGLIEDARDAKATPALTTAAETTLGRRLGPDEAAQVVTAVERKLWDNVPGVSRDEATAIMQQIEREVASTWRDLRAAGHDPVFVHKVSPSRANSALAGNIGPVPVKQSATKERVLDLSPGVNDVQISMTHAAGEMLQKRYTETFVEQVIDSVGKTEAQLRDELSDAANWRTGIDPSLDFEGHLQQMIRRGYERFNPDEAGTAWGGVRLDKYRGDNKVYIPKAVADNLHRYAKPPSILSSVTDPLTKAFRYNVIGLSPSVIVNNFFSNSVAMTAESGIRPWKHWNAAREWLRNPELIPNEQLKGMILAEMPNMESLNRDAWLKSRVGQRFMSGYNAGKAFQDSTMAKVAGGAKAKLDAVVSRSLDAQRWGDNVYRAMQYMDEVERGVSKGKTADAAANSAMEMVRRTFVDYTSFTPIERSAMRTIVPFYSYMGHAARFIARYPLDHPLRASVASKLAEAERERLGTLPGSFLSMVPLPFGLGKMNSDGKKNMLALRPFDPFGDISDLLSVAGWMSAMNPLIQTGLQQVGVIRGEADLYPTLRYDPETGRMKAVHGNLLTDLFNNTMPRAGLITSFLGINSQQNELRQRDPEAANRNLLSMAGLPRAWRQVDVPKEQFQAEISRDRSATLVRNDAIRTGDWRDALRYPSLRGYYDALSQLPPEMVAEMTPATAEAIANQINGVVS